MYILLIYTLVFSIITMGLFGRFLGTKGIFFFSNLMMFLCLIYALFMVYETAFASSFTVVKLGAWIHVGTLILDWGFLFDSISSTMLVVVLFVSFFVHLFSVSYMNEDPHVIRFFFFLTLFTFFMVILVTADNFVQMFLGWEGVGIASYLLINFWFTRYQANKSAIKAICLNRIGDFGIIIALAALFFKFNTFNYLTVFSLLEFMVDEKIQIYLFSFDYLTFIVCFLFIGAVGKSAQLGLHLWLPDAMEGPTPVSALIHAATMVTAGVFVLIRCAPLLEYTPLMKNIIVICGATTAFFAGTVGAIQNDIKRIIAFSTCSQLGYMVFMCGLSGYEIAFFHLVNHAFFKALLFLSAGAVIHSINDEQDIRKMGGLLKPLNFSYIMFVIGSLALTGFPFLTGFYSKDVIIEYSYGTYTCYGLYAFVLGLATACITAFYSVRLLYLVFFTKSNNTRSNMQLLHETSIYTYIALIFLALGSIFFGYIFKDLFIGYGSAFWDVFYKIYPYKYECTYEYIPFVYKITPLVFSFLGMFCSYIICKSNGLVFIKIINIYTFLIKKWGFDIIYHKYITSTILSLGYNFFHKIIDRGFFELIGPVGLTRLFYKLSLHIRNIQTGFLYHYLFMFSFNIFIFLFFSLVLFFSLDLFIILFLFFNFYKLYSR